MMPKKNNKKVCDSTKKINSFKVKYGGRECFNAIKEKRDPGEYYKNFQRCSEANGEDSSMVQRNILYKNPDLYSNEYNRGDNVQSFVQSSATHWVDQGEAIQDWSQNKYLRNQRKNTNKLSKTLNKMLAKPVEISKGKSLLEKMGWKGGGLGKDGAGILEPIAPEAAYASKTIGLGHGSQYNKNLPQADQEFGRNFRTNVLRKILDFVKDNTKIYLAFDKSLLKSERKRIHDICEELREAESVDSFDYEKEIDLDLAKEILEYNSYLLVTESNGKAKERHLCIYKEALEHIYLIIPDDLQDKEKDLENCDEQTDFAVDIEKPVNENALNREQNINNVSKDEKNGNLDQEIKSLHEISNNENLKITQTTEIESKIVTENIIDTKEISTEYSNHETPKNEILTKIIDFFKEFVEEEVYTQFRFLGTFNDNENEAIEMFFNMFQCKDTVFSEAFDNDSYDLNLIEDFNGCWLIQKIKYNLMF